MASGVRSVGEMPVPPVVRMTSYPASTPVAQGGLDRVAVGDDPRAVDREAERGEPLGEQGAALVLVDPGGGAVGGGDDQGAYGRSGRPERRLAPAPS